MSFTETVLEKITNQEHRKAWQMLLAHLRFESTHKNIEVQNLRRLPQMMEDISSFYDDLNDRGYFDYYREIFPEDKHVPTESVTSDFMALIIYVMHRVPQITDIVRFLLILRENFLLPIQEKVDAHFEKKKKEPKKTWIDSLIRGLPQETTEDIREMLKTVGFEVISWGRFRTAFRFPSHYGKISQEAVLKVANFKDHEGHDVFQDAKKMNQLEVNNKMTTKYPEITVRTWASAKDFSWIIQERVSPLSVPQVNAAFEKTVPEVVWFRHELKKLYDSGSFHKIPIASNIEQFIEHFSLPVMFEFVHTLMFPDAKGKTMTELKRLSSFFGVENKDGSIFFWVKKFFGGNAKIQSRAMSKFFHRSEIRKIVSFANEFNVDLSDLRQANLAVRMNGDLIVLDPGIGNLEAFDRITKKKV